MKMKNYTIDDLAEGVKGVAEVQQLMDKLVESIKNNKKKKGQSLLEDIAETQQKMMSYSKLITDELNLFSELINPETRERKTKQILHNSAHIVRDYRSGRSASTLRFPYRFSL